MPDENPKTLEKKPAIEQIYDAINEVLGGTNPQQMLCLTIPGTVLDKKTYVYDTRYEKPLKVAANESRLANKMFDVSTVTGSDNGRTLSQQFLSALDALTPKMNRRLIQAKDELRELLRMPKSYQMEDGTTVNGTLQQAFYYLYGEYVKEKKNWADMQNRERARLEEKYPGNGDEVYNQRQEAFLNWYQTVAESYLLDIQVKRGKVLSIFSPNDMKIIEGVLDSGSGAEVEEAREQVENARKFDPDGGYVYPVTFQPEDWFESLDSNMGYIDLLQSSDAYALQYSNLNLKRKAILRKITTFEQKNKNQELTNAVAALKKAQGNMESAEADLNDKFADNANICLSGVLELLPETGEDNDPNAERNNNNLTAMFHQLDVKKLLKPEVLSDINNAYKASYAATSAYVRASQEVADAARILMEAKSQDYTPELKESYQQLENINEEMEQIKEKLQVALVKEQAQDLNDQLFPDAYERRYEEILIETDSSNIAQSSNAHSSSSTSTGGVNFFFGGGSFSSESAQSISEDSFAQSNLSVSIGFLATKVSFVRNWFNPGVFVLSKNMFRSAAARVSSGSKNPQDQKDCIFPCYPTAFVIAKDVTIKITYGSETSESMKKAIEEHSSRGGGFLGFSGRKSISGSEEKSSSSSVSNENSTTIKIPGSQIIGYYLEITPQDSSIPMEGMEEDMNSSIMEFAAHCREVLQEE